MTAELHKLTITAALKEAEFYRARANSAYCERVLVRLADEVESLRRDIDGYNSAIAQRDTEIERLCAVIRDTTIFRTLSVPEFWEAIRKAKVDDAARTVSNESKKGTKTLTPCDWGCRYDAHGKLKVHYACHVHVVLCDGPYDRSNSQQNEREPFVPCDWLCFYNLEGKLLAHPACQTHANGDRVVNTKSLEALKIERDTLAVLLGMLIRKIDSESNYTIELHRARTYLANI